MPFSAQKPTKQRVTRPQNSHQIRVNFEENFNENFGQIGADFEPNSANFSAPIRSVSQNKTEKNGQNPRGHSPFSCHFLRTFHTFFARKPDTREAFHCKKF